MRQLQEAVRRFLHSEDGPTAVEYAFLAVLVIAACLLAIVALGKNTSGVMGNDAQKISSGS